MTRECLVSTFLLVAATSGVLAQQNGKARKFLKKPLVIEDQGSFFIGGVPKVTTYATVPPPTQTLTPNQITIGQMYVQFQIPATRKPNMPPVIMVHGSSHTAACLESTPDGREGWAPYFVRNGISTYIVDTLVWHASCPEMGQEAAVPTFSEPILVVEDDDTMSLLMATVLTGYGYCVDIAEDGADGWEALHATAYDLLITDNFMPKVTGIGMIQKLQATGMQ